MNWKSLGASYCSSFSHSEMLHCNPKHEAFFTLHWWKHSLRHCFFMQTAHVIKGLVCAKSSSWPVDVRCSLQMSNVGIARETCEKHKFSGPLKTCRNREALGVQPSVCVLISSPGDSGATLKMENDGSRHGTWTIEQHSWAWFWWLCSCVVRLIKCAWQTVV